MRPFLSFLGRCLPPHRPRIAATNVVVAHSIDGRPVHRHLIPARSSAHLKTLNQAVAHCGTHGKCDEEVQALLFPIVVKLTNSRDVEFSVGTERVDLRAVRDDIHEIAAGTVSKMRYLQRDRTIGRWWTAGGRIPPIEVDPDGLLFESSSEPISSAIVVPGNAAWFTSSSRAATPISTPGSSSTCFRRFAGASRECARPWLRSHTLRCRAQARCLTMHHHEAAPGLRD